MTKPNTPLAIAVDGGGTRCRLLLCTDGSDTTVEVGSCNVSTDFLRGLTEIERGLKLLSQKSGFSSEILATLPCFMGLAGVVSAQIANQLARALPLQHCRIQDDRNAALRGALAEGDGAIAHCGTGSFLASQIQGQARIVGGWGSILGDEASAQWLARRALSKTLDVADELSPPSPLSDHLHELLKGPAGIVEFSAGATPAEMGEMAPLITTLAGEGDAIAQDLMREGAGYLAWILPKIGWKQGLALCLTGGLAPCYAPYFPQIMQDAIAAPLGDPLSGARRLALDYARELAATGPGVPEQGEASA